ncbi:TatD DNase family protein [Pseudooceanicola antarcticus]|uniref:TatD DNase family protein n=1 Tax=Pseudooceanicola antarcticus TaxID=1247613 RepID=A0A285IIY3_9RHOB|nr:TatD family hydrolase [Pseudooceanicola antarcticus]PJE28869.1 TatD family deoxyribonuclease [Pseudooceanicola antarcticus]SNY47928.1 TatD DNase family protein [Pseudooceanicola antarcticus]
MTDTPQITDSHCHLDFPDFDGELDQVIARAHAAGVSRMVSICTKPGSIAKVRAIAEAHASVFWAYGLHPMSVADEAPVSFDELVEVAQHPKLVAIGETGLDYHYTAESAEAQKASLRVHCAAAAETGLPLVIHARDADEDMARILEEEYRNAPYSCVMHCFSSGAELGRKALDLGFYLSMSGVTTFKKSQELRDFFATVPLERVLVETDSPYLAPPPHRGKRNEPAYTALTAQVGAEVFGLDYAAFAAQTQSNFDRLFTKVGAWQARAA